MSDPVETLAAGVLRRFCPPESFDFETTSDIPDLATVLGQPRAVAALKFGASIASHGFNLFALGQTGSGRTTLIREFLEKRAAGDAVPDDVCMVFNFSDKRRPLPLSLPAGRGATFRDDLDAIIQELQTAIPRAFDSEDYTKQRDSVVREFESQREQAVHAVEQRVREAGFRLLKGPSGLLILPFAGEKPISEEDLELLKSEQRDKVNRVREMLQHEVEDGLRRVRDLEKNAKEAFRKLERETASFAISHLIDDLQAKYSDVPAVVDYLRPFRRTSSKIWMIFARPKRRSRRRLCFHCGTGGAPFHKILRESPGG